jgi:hypothetical protein
MTEENKELLHKDLCARLPYGVKIYAKYIDIDTEVEKIGVLSMVDNDAVVAFTTDDTNCYIYVTINEVKPYLFPLSSMTEEQKKEFKEISKCECEIKDYGGYDSEGVYLIEIGKYEYEHDIDITVEQFYFNDEIIDWLNRNNFDYRGLIPMGLANDATGKNIY